MDTLTSNDQPSADEGSSIRIEVALDHVETVSGKHYTIDLTEDWKIVLQPCQWCIIGSVVAEGDWPF
jgi:hypothetical protein